MAKKLSDTVIAQRMQELRNLKILHERDRKQIRELKAENIALRALEAEQQATIETLKIQIAELQVMVFGKKKPPTGHHLPNAILDTAKPPRGKDSFRRPLPPASAITAEEAILLPKTCSCGGSFTHITTHERYQEDIPLPDLTKDYQAHLVTKYIIKRGICCSCGKASSGRELGGQAVSLGPNVRLLICHLVSVTGLSYAQITQLCLSLYNLHITDGEIATVIAKAHTRWLSAYEQLKADIRSSPAVHADETSWPIQNLNRQGYGWVLAASDNSKSCFALENSRGAPHAKKLLGSYRGIRITDNYGVYLALPGQQQLCWAHLYRCIRDLCYNENLPEEQLPYVSWWHKQFVGIYQQLQAYLAEPCDKQKRLEQSEELWQRLKLLLLIQNGEPDKLTRLKAQLKRAGKDRLFTCLPSYISCDNNRAERDLRALVLKRKRSFGSKTIEGAKALATVLSICTNVWRENPTSYFKTLATISR